MNSPSQTPLTPTSGRLLPPTSTPRRNTALVHRPTTSYLTTSTMTPNQKSLLSDTMFTTPSKLRSPKRSAHTPTPSRFTSATYRSYLHRQQFSTPTHTARSPLYFPPRAGTPSQATTTDSSITTASTTTTATTPCRSTTLHAGGTPGMVPLNEDAIAQTPTRENNDQWLTNFGIDISLLKLVDEQYAPQLPDSTTKSAHNKSSFEQEIEALITPLKQHTAPSPSSSPFAVPPKTPTPDENVHPNIRELDLLRGHVTTDSFVTPVSKPSFVHFNHRLSSPSLSPLPYASASNASADAIPPPLPLPPQPLQQQPAAPSLSSPTGRRPAVAVVDTNVDINPPVSAMPTAAGNTTHATQTTSTRFAHEDAAGNMVLQNVGWVNNALAVSRPRLASNLPSRIPRPTRSSNSPGHSVSSSSSASARKAATTATTTGTMGNPTSAVTRQAPMAGKSPLAWKSSLAKKSPSAIPAPGTLQQQRQLQQSQQKQQKQKDQQGCQEEQRQHTPPVAVPMDVAPTRTPTRTPRRVQILEDDAKERALSVRRHRRSSRRVSTRELRSLVDPLEVVNAGDERTGAEMKADTKTNPQGHAESPDVSHAKDKDSTPEKQQAAFTPRRSKRLSSRVVVSAPRGGAGPTDGGGGGSSVMFTPVRANRRQQEELGSSTVVTPVRRSVRLSQRHKAVEKLPRAEEHQDGNDGKEDASVVAKGGPSQDRTKLLEKADYAYAPNHSLV